MERRRVEHTTGAGRGPLRPLSLGRTVPSGKRPDEPVPAVPVGVPEHGVAPDRVSPSEGQLVAELPAETLVIALIVPLRNWVSFAKNLQPNIRVRKPKGYAGAVEIRVLPDLGDDLIDFDQFDTPTVDLTLLKAALKP